MALTIKEVKARVQSIKELSDRDAESAHGREDDLYADVLKAIAAGDVTPTKAQKMAREALESKRIAFARHTA